MGRKDASVIKSTILKGGQLQWTKGSSVRSIFPQLRSCQIVRSPDPYQIDTHLQMRHGGLDTSGCHDYLRYVTLIIAYVDLNEPSKY